MFTLRRRLLIDLGVVGIVFGVGFLTGKIDTKKVASGIPKGAPPTLRFDGKFQVGDGNALFTIINRSTSDALVQLQPENSMSVKVVDNAISGEESIFA